MGVYFFTGLISCFFCYLDTTLLREKRNSATISRRMFSFFLRLISILIPCFVAGFRDQGIGTDTINYGLPLFQYARYYDFESTLEYMGLEPGYVLLVYTITKCTDKVFWEYFIIEFIIMYFTYKALLNLNLKRNTWYGLFVYYIVFFPFSLNLMRQMMAASMVLWAYQYVENKKLLKYIISVLVATSIHKVAIITICIYPLYWIFRDSGEDIRSSFQKAINKHRVSLSCIVIFLALSILANTRELILLFSTFKRSYMDQVSAMNQQFVIDWRVVVPITMISLPIFQWCIFQKNRGNNKLFFLVIISMSLIFWLMQGISSETYRVTLYFWYFLIIIYPVMLSTTKHRSVGKIYLIVVGNIYFYIFYIIMLFNHVYPYTSTLLGIG